MGRKLQLGALLAVIAFAGGCAPAYHVTEQQIADLRALVASAETAAQQAASQSTSDSGGEQMASQAQAAANEALAAANAAQAAVDATNERLDRMFEEAQAK